MSVSDTRPPRTMADAVPGQYSPVDDATATSWRDAGCWEDRTVRSLLADAAAQAPDRIALIGRRSNSTRVTRTYAEFDRNASHAAGVFAALGIGPGDSVAVMLPNWIEYAEIIFGINEIGAVYTGIPVAYGESQAAAILRRSAATVLVIPRRWRSTDHLALARSIRSSVPSIVHLVVVGETVDAVDLGPSECSWATAESVPPARVDAQADRLCYLGFTSGTTGEPKGAMHTHDTLVYSARRQLEHVGAGNWGDPLIQLVASPIGHHTGFEWGVLFTVMAMGTAVHVDRWDPEWGSSVIREEGVTCFFGAPTFLQDLLNTTLVGDPSCPLRCVVVAGSPVPRGLAEHARTELGAYIAPAWGMTECSIVTSATPKESDDILRTDGSVFAGSAVDIVDGSGVSVPVGTVGDLLVRGPGVTLGYFDRPDATEQAFADGLWFRSGDRAAVDASGWLSLHGRTKDIVIRGGENIPVTDIESAVCDHPDVMSAAVVGVPDERLGERVCAVLVMREGVTAPTVPELADFLSDRGLSRHWLPERVEMISAMPMTPSGKIQKNVLREKIQRELTMSIGET